MVVVRAMLGRCTREVGYGFPRRHIRRFRRVQIGSVLAQARVARRLPLAFDHSTLRRRSPRVMARGSAPTCEHFIAVRQGVRMRVELQAFGTTNSPTLGEAT